MKKQLLFFAVLTGFIACRSWSATHGFIKEIVNKSSYLVRIQTTDSKEFIALKDGRTLKGDQIQDKSFMLSDIGGLNLIIPWEGWDGQARIYIDVFKSSDFSDPKSLVLRNMVKERDSKVQLTKQEQLITPEKMIYEECRNFDTDYTIEVTPSGEIKIASKKVNKNPGDIDWCDDRWSEVKAPSLYVGTCWPGSRLTQKKACADWCEGSFDNVEQWTCSENKMYCICKDGITPGSHNIFNKIGDAARNAGETIYDKALKPAGDNIAKYGKIATDVMGTMVENWFKKRPKPDYCKFSKNSLLNPPTIDSMEAKKIDMDGMLPYIEKYAPHAWIEGNELYHPMLFSEYITAPTTSIIDQGAGGKTVVPAGSVTLEKMYEMYLDYKKDQKKYHLNGDTDQDRSHALKIADCTTFGSDPDQHKKGDILTTPIYAITFESNGKLYIQYLFFYGYNGPYDVGPLKGNVLEIQDAHEGDLEHMTMELNKETKELERIYYSSHGTKEGFWLNAHDSDVEYEGTHPVAYISHYSHAIYPKEGTFVRIWGIANDITSQGEKWNPQVIRLYPESDKRFDPKTMGFMYFPGYYGEHGVGAVANQGWFMNPSGGDIGRPYTPSKWFCNNPPHRSGIDKIKEGADQIEYGVCIIKSIPNAKAPE